MTEVCFWSKYYEEDVKELRKATDIVRELIKNEIKPVISFAPLQQIISEYTLCNTCDYRRGLLQVECTMEKNFQPEI